jgi:tetratricopeptide (TPR) repeat protein
MIKSALAMLLSISFISVAQGQQEKPAAAAPSKQQAQSGFIAPSDVNVRIEPDVRMFIMMAMINVAGFDYETSGQEISPARAEIRKDLSGISPQLKEKLSAFYKAHRRAGVDEATDAARYAALSLLMTQPPGFTIYSSREQALPEDLEQLLTTEKNDSEPTLVKLVREFYLTSGIKNLLPKYTTVARTYATAYRTPVGSLIYQTLEYFHTNPETIINMRPLVVTTGDSDAKSKKSSQTVVARNRSRQVFVIPDPLEAMNTSFARGDILNLKEDLLTRRIGDDYIVIIGPSRTVNTDAVRQALIRFVIDPIVERHLKTSLDYKEQILKLAASAPAAAKQVGSSVYLIIRESLAQAAESRLRRISSATGGPAYSEDDAVYDLAQAYLRGAVLSFQFYESLKGLEQVGISIETVFDDMVATTKFDREAARPKEFEPVVARVSAARRAKASKPETADADPDDASVNSLAKKILLSDDLIRQKKFAEARTVLESALAIAPNNARALYGMAQAISQTPSPAELDPNVDENDKIQAQHDRLEQSIKLYRKAIEQASRDSEMWLVQWSHVLLGRIYDFQEFRADAIAEYEAAIKLGDVPHGALKEANEGKQRPYGQKN